MVVTGYSQPSQSAPSGLAVGTVGTPSRQKGGGYPSLAVSRQLTAPLAA
jgi:hypothetical protein